VLRDCIVPLLVWVLLLSVTALMHGMLWGSFAGDFPSHLGFPSTALVSTRYFIFVLPISLYIHENSLILSSI
jgi:hypothetical protein